MKRIFLNNWAKVAALCACAAVVSVVSCGKPEGETPEQKLAKDVKISKGGEIVMGKDLAEDLGKKEGDKLKFDDRLIVVDG